MSDFRLSQALDGSAELESICCDIKDVQLETINIDENLDLVLSQDRKTMRKVANLVLVVNRMINLSKCGGELKDYELCSMIMDQVVEECIVKTDGNSTIGELTFQPLNSVKQFTLSDRSKKDVILNSNEFTLKAITLKGGNSHHKVNFKMSMYISSTKCDGCMVVLSIMNDLYISCSKPEDKVVLKLEKISKEKIKEDEDKYRFVFIKTTTGITLTSFESLKYRSWFISTSSEEERPVEMCEADAVCRITHFRVNC
ncbi:interleukin-1 beta [Odontesthes bonariensis]|uniref:interleukin-1 beta n=1 Tax=Odontesthes bonariensis TaxID=219752 RepID=UPI003F582BFB